MRAHMFVVLYMARACDALLAFAAQHAPPRARLTCDNVSYTSRAEVHVPTSDARAPPCARARDVTVDCDGVYEYNRRA